MFSHGTFNTPKKRSPNIGRTGRTCICQLARQPLEHRQLTRPAWLISTIGPEINAPRPFEMTVLPSLPRGQADPPLPCKHAPIAREAMRFPLGRKPRGSQVGQKALRLTKPTKGVRAMILRSSEIDQ